ncbi:NUMOD4 motif protein [Anaerotignum neopropionicum]|uniref:NUMOD4 motif protein n=1 Tax=Anaerotignum neopropionicum TaxID=36847 RepID=A0A136WG54_9FIRM|nr:NUMOD4 domain-containing protein [Anaerotignum neopropionicum]KXL53383.1 NUMOD4 motif protein [Anaerotignum neopropionicum]
MIEQWKDIKDFEGIYQVSNLGRIKSLERIVIDKKGMKKICKETIKTIHDNGKGYLNVNLWKDNKSYMRYVHRLVAQAFIPNLEDKSTVNHKDFNRSNNCVDNLEWATYSENNGYSDRLERQGKTFRKTNPFNKPINQYDLDGNYIQQFQSIREAERVVNDGTGSNIYRVCKGQYKQSLGYIWKYAS